MGNKLQKVKEQVNNYSLEIMVEAQTMRGEIADFATKHGRKFKYATYALIGLVLCATMVLMSPLVVYAGGTGTIDGVFTRANTQMQAVLRQIRTISTIVAALFLAVCFIMKMFSKNQKSVDEANAWIKRILIAWACMNAIGFILGFVQDIIGQDQALPTIGNP